MKKEIRELFPKWIDETNIKYDLILGDDVDSSIGCNLLKVITNNKWDINYFYDFQNFYRHEKTENKTIGVDMAFLKKVRCFDNHLSKRTKNDIYNELCANLNLVYNVSCENYTKKYSMSTLMLIMSLYDIPLPKTTEGKEILLAIDTAFKGFYSETFRPIHTNWLETLGYTELIDVLKQRDAKYFYEIIQQYGLHKKIYIDENGCLQSEIRFGAIQPFFDFEIGLPEQQFKLIKQCKRANHDVSKQMPERERIISLAYTKRDFVSYTYY
ncbi:hypothetical protein GGR02_003023 [Anoxybacillus voinovskiensis]|uniref:Uncharacterized protein n=1 Tax=Anoxybacteroides voinovskiense TaxID=230470 RepID=A0A840E1Z5_9BACL|nr:hypothetical protein [Anoxybacillus voinovskiensis]MBB4075206.1 hypothetical protein [Anoxybacillus voinovskiensis]GGJ77131.1 hypothetical protein GCM10008982_28110 [Anoxybacillus voinovskiensis]